MKRVPHQGSGRPLVFGLAAVALLCAANASLAHQCGPPLVQLKPGECRSWQIKADISESQETDYGVTSFPNAAVATVTPASPAFVGFPFSSFDFGTYRICGVALGATSMTAAWSYAPTPAMGSCAAAIDVSNAPITPSSNADAEFAGVNGDPVDMYSGELFQHFQPDLDLRGPFPLRYQRYFSSQLTQSGARRGNLGEGWLDSFTMSLSGTSSRVDIDFLWGRRLRFDKVGADWTLFSPAGTGFQLRQVGAIYTLMDPAEQRRYVFDGDGRLTAIKDRNDNTLTLTYSAGNQGVVPVAVSDGLGRTLTFTLQGHSQYASVSDGTRTVSFTYANVTATASHLTSFIDAAGRTTTYSYANAVSARPGLLTADIQPVGNTPLTTAYNAQFRVASQTNAASNQDVFAWSPPASSITLPGGAVRGYAHDTQGRQTGYTNQAGATQAFTYNGNRRGGVSDFANDLRAMTFHAASGYIASATDELGNTINYTYQATTAADGFVYHDLASVQFGDGRTYAFGYDNKGNRTSVTAPGGANWTTTFNARGQPLVETSPLGGTINHVYNASGLLISRSDAAGNLTSYGYDTLHRLNLITRPGGATRAFTHDVFGQIASITDERGTVTSYGYDFNGRSTSETSPAGTRTFAYDTSDRSTGVTDRLTDTVTRSYDSRSRPLVDQRSNGEQLQYGWDSRDNRTSVTVPAGVAWTFAYDAKNRMTGSTDPTGATTSFVYDKLGQVTRIDWPGGGSESFQYDAMGRITRQTDARNRVTQYQYDASGRLNRFIVGSNQLAVTSAAPDVVTQIVDPNGNPWNYGYDTGARLISATDPLGAIRGFGYDNRGRYASITYPAAMGSETLSYDARSHLTQRSFSDATTISYGYDALGRVTSGSAFSAGYDAEGRVTASNGLVITRSAATGRIASIVYPAGPTVTYGYVGGRLVSISDGLGGTTTISHDATGRPTQFVFPNGSQTNWTYDARGALARIQHGAVVDLQITRDLSGFVSSASRTQPTQHQPPVATFNQSANAALSVSQVTSDALGRVLAADGISFSWDLASRLATRTAAASVATYAWDAMYHLVGRSEGGNNEAFLWNYATAQPAVATSSVGGVAQWHYVSLPDGRLLYRINAASNVRQYYVFDEVGNTVALLDAADSVVASYGYSVYGQRLAAGGGGNPFTWGGQHFTITDAAASLYVMGARVYDGERMRFLSRDVNAPHLNPLSFNPFAYAAGNPLYFVDPSGDDNQPASAPTALDGASEIVNTVSAAGNGVDLATELATKNLSAAKDTTIALSRQLTQGGQTATLARGPLNAAVSTQQTAQKALNQATSKGMKVVGNLGNAATFLSGCIEAYKLNGKLGQHEQDWSRNVQNAIRFAENAGERAFEAYKAGNITYAQLRKRLQDIKDLLDSQMKNEQLLYDLNVWISSADAYFSFGMGLAPGGDKLYLGLKSALGVNP